MFELCLFDLDDTLVRTGDLKEVRERGKNHDSPEYRSRVASALQRKKRLIYETSLLSAIRNEFPEIRFGVFTRSPRSYAETVLEHAYPGFKWDVLIAYEDVNRTKPYGEGILRAAHKVGLNSLDRAVMVGDQSSDIQAAYNAGIPAVLDTRTWPFRRTSDNWRAVGYVPDAIISHPRTLLSVMQNLHQFQPDLERLFAGTERSTVPRRFDRLNKFMPKEYQHDRTPYPVFVCGRFFAEHDSNFQRRQWHRLTKSVLDNKDSTAFPDEWIQSIHGFIKSNYRRIEKGKGLVVCVVPHRPHRTPRMERLLDQLRAHVAANPFPDSINVTFEPDLLAYREGVQSQHRLNLRAKERFANVHNHLYVSKPRSVGGGKPVLVVDDVCTTGSSLICAGKCLQDAGSGAVTRLAISSNIGNVLYG